MTLFLLMYDFFIHIHSPQHGSNKRTFQFFRNCQSRICLSWKRDCDSFMKAKIEDTQIQSSMMDLLQTKQIKINKQRILLLDQSSILFPDLNFDENFSFHTVHLQVRMLTSSPKQPMNVYLCLHGDQHMIPHQRRKPVDPSLSKW